MVWAIEAITKRKATIEAHGFQMLEDIGQDNYPGYGLYGRMKSLAEIRGLERGILSQMN